jgi:DNA-binding CsgD family transcriptional regulator
LADAVVDECSTETSGAIENAARHLLELVLDLSSEVQGDGVCLDLMVDGARCVVTVAPDVPPSADCVDSSTPLSPREQEIARMVADGLTNKEIATLLEISAWTVSTHVRRIFSKLDVSTRAAMVARLLPSGLIGVVTPNGRDSPNARL